MKFPLFKRMTLETFPNSPSWFAPLYLVINPIVDALNTMLQSNLTVKDNVTSETTTTAFTHNTPQKIKLNVLTVAPTGLLIGYASGQIPTGYAITNFFSNNTVEVTMLFNGAPTNPVNVTLTFLV